MAAPAMGAAWPACMCWKPSNSDAYSITIEGSGSGAFAGEESTLATFTLDGRALGSEQVKIDGRIPRYARWRATAGPSASDRIRIAISLIRK